MNEAIRHYTNEFRAGRDVSPFDAEVLFDSMISETDELPLVELLREWTRKGTTEDELYRFASIMRTRMRPLEHDVDQVVDIVGTGGSKIKTFNVSTAAAFVIAGAGVAVAKHGNRAATSSSGSADVLDELGIEVDPDPSQAKNDLLEYGICFMFAPRYHSLSPVLAKARRSLGEPTIFNNLGPLCNPAKVRRQVIGVYDQNLVTKTARVLARLRTEHSWVVCGDGGLDEISSWGPTKVAEVKGTSIREFTVVPDDFANTQPSQPGERFFSPSESAGLIRDILAGDHRTDPIKELVTLNAAACLYVAGRVDNLNDACLLARDSICSGRAAKKLDELRRISKK